MLGPSQTVYLYPSFDSAKGASAFNQPLNLDTSSVTTMYGMFYLASAFDQPLSLDTSSVTNMNGMFYSASVFNQPLNLDTSSVTDMSYMFAVRPARVPCAQCPLEPSPRKLLAPPSPHAPLPHPMPLPSPCLHLAPPPRMSSVRLGSERRRSISR